jgi:hypothetical protein
MDFKKQIGAAGDDYSKIPDLVNRKPLGFLTRKELGMFSQTSKDNLNISEEERKKRKKEYRRELTEQIGKSQIPKVQINRMIRKKSPNLKYILDELTKNPDKYSVTKKNIIDFLNERLINDALNDIQDIETVKYLVENGVDVNTVDSSGYTLLMKTKSLDVVKYLVENGADIHKIDNEEANILHHASSKGNLPIVKYLVENGADVNKQDNKGWTPLMEASYMGKINIVKYLVENGAKINIRNNSGKTAYTILNNKSNSAKDRLESIYGSELYQVIQNLQHA